MKHYYIHIGGEGSQQNFRKSDWLGVNIKLKVTSFLDGPLFRPRAKNGGFQLVAYIKEPARGGAFIVCALEQAFMQLCILDRH